MFCQLVLLSFGFLLKLSLSSCNYAMSANSQFPIAADECQWASFESMKLTCSGTTATVDYYNSSSSCSGASTDITSQVVSSCGNDASCGTLKLKIFYNSGTNCSGYVSILLAEYFIIDDMPCTVLNSTAVTFSATTSKLTYTTWSESNCTGSSVSTYLEAGCNDQLKYVISEVSTDSANTTDNGNTTDTGTGTSAANKKYNTSIILVIAMFAALSTWMMKA